MPLLLIFVLLFFFLCAIICRIIVTFFHSPIAVSKAHYLIGILVINGVLITSLEALVVALGCVVIFKCARQRGSRVMTLLLAGTYMSYFAFAWLEWG